MTFYVVLELVLEQPIPEHARFVWICNEEI